MNNYKIDISIIDWDISNEDIHDAMEGVEDMDEDQAEDIIIASLDRNYTYYIEAENRDEAIGMAYGELYDDIPYAVNNSDSHIVYTGNSILGRVYDYIDYCDGDETVQVVVRGEKLYEYHIPSNGYFSDIAGNNFIHKPIDMEKMKKYWNNSIVCIEGEWVNIYAKERVVFSEKTKEYMNNEGINEEDMIKIINKVEQVRLLQ